jgi:thioesterase domain-containing protein
VSTISAGRRELLNRLRGDQPAADEPVSAPAAVVTLATGSAPPLVLAPAVSGSAFAYAGLGRLLDGDRPVYAFENPGLDGGRPAASIPDLAAEYRRALGATAPDGPYLVGGWSFGGTVAFELAHQLLAAGAQVTALLLIDGAVPGPFPEPDPVEVAAAFVADLAAATGQPVPAETPPAADPAELAGFLRRHGLFPPGVPAGVAAARFAVFRANMRAHRAYRPRPLRVPAVLIRGAGSDEPFAGWRRLLDPPPREMVVPGDHYSMWSPEHLRSLARAIQDGSTHAHRRTPRCDDHR